MVTFCMEKETLCASIPALGFKKRFSGPCGGVHLQMIIQTVDPRTRTFSSISDLQYVQQCTNLVRQPRLCHTSAAWKVRDCFGEPQSTRLHRISHGSQFPINMGCAPCNFLSLRISQNIHKSQSSICYFNGAFLPPRSYHFHTMQRLLPTKYPIRKSQKRRNLQGSIS
jgi:hypothetical protein